jgi:hypothetical protein
VSAPTPAPREPSREELAAAMAANAARKPINIAVPVVVIAAGLIAGLSVVIVLPVAAVLYAAAAARTLFSAGEAERVAARLRDRP